MRHFARVVMFAAIAALFVPNARAGITAVDVATSTVMQHNQTSFSGLGFRAHVSDSRLISNIEFLPYVDYWRNTSTVETFNIRSTRSDATLGVDARYMGAFKALHPYVGAGYGLHFFETEVQAPTLGLPNATNSLVKGGIDLLGGLNFAISDKLQNFIEVKYHHMPDYGQVKISMGLAFGKF
jgi:outer membrane protein W